VNFKDEIAWKRILKLYEGIGMVTAERIWQDINKYATLVELLDDQMALSSARAKSSWDKIVKLFKYLVEVQTDKKGFIAHAVTMILERSYEDYVRNAFDNYEDRLEDLTQFVDFVVTYENLDKLLDDIMLSESFAQDTAAVDNSVVLSTIHQAKGLEWPHVMILSLRDGDFPHHRSFEDMNQLEEERRLFYVAVTRAKDELSLLFPVRKFSYQFGETNSGPSLFVKELDQCYYVEVSSSDRYDQTNYDDYEETIYFD
jgi:DNA helicase-2/ATP-dependent DNA helicase PcrA